MYRVTAVFLTDEDAKWAAMSLRKLSDALAVTIEEIKVVDQQMPAETLPESAIILASKQKGEKL